MFNVGDRVKTSKEVNLSRSGRGLYPLPKGICGKIIKIKNSHIGNIYGIEFDEKIPGGHSCHFSGKNGYCWEMYAEHIVKEDNSVASMIDDAIDSVYNISEYGKEPIDAIVRDMIINNKYIDSIKFVRVKLGLGLDEAKDYVDRIKDSLQVF